MFCFKRYWLGERSEPIGEEAPEATPQSQGVLGGDPLTQVIVRQLPLEETPAILELKNENREIATATRIDAQRDGLYTRHFEEA